MTPLHEACFRGSASCADILLKHGAEIHFKKEKVVEPFTDQFFDSLNPKLQEVIVKHMQWRQMRLLAGMVDTVGCKYDKLSMAMNKQKSTVGVTNEPEGLTEK